MKNIKLSQTVLILFLFFLIFSGLYFAKPFLVPLSIAGLLSMLFLPVCKFFEKKGINRVLASLFCVLIFVCVIAGIGALIGWQISDLAKDSTKIEKNITSFIDKAKSSLESSFGISQQKQQEVIQQQKKSGGSGVGSIVKAIMSSTSGFLVNTLLVLVYLFLFLYFRRHLKDFILKLVPQTEKSNTKKIIDQSTSVAQKYLSGLSIMIVILWIMYGIGFSVAGVKNAFFFAILCGLLEIVPFVGNITGTALTIIASMATGGSLNVIIGILIVYGLVQFIQTYILEPLVVGEEISINPLFTIIGLVVGELVWGIPGMVVALPVLGMLKVIFDNIDPLKPYGFLIGSQKKENNFKDKMKKFFHKK